jgi:hypothetical protein
MVKVWLSRFIVRRPGGARMAGPQAVCRTPLAGLAPGYAQGRETRVESAESDDGARGMDGMGRSAVMNISASSGGPAISMLLAGGHIALESAGRPSRRSGTTHHTRASAHPGARASPAGLAPTRITSAQVTAMHPPGPSAPDLPAFSVPPGSIAECSAALPGGGQAAGPGHVKQLPVLSQYEQG